jgi:ABC-type polysaccharide/polyol phosphate transport system ATPase subunit
LSRVKDLMWQKWKQSALCVSNRLKTSRINLNVNLKIKRPHVLSLCLKAIWDIFRESTMHRIHRFCFQAKSLTKIHVTGENTLHALRGSSFDIPKVDFVVMLEPSGIGKSTFLNIISRLDHPKSGQVFF